MIAVDTSALIAVLIREPDAADHLAAMAAADHVLIGQPTIIELYLVAAGKTKPASNADAMAFIDLPHFRHVDFTAEHRAAAIDAFTRFGRGSGHPAKLNYGDCMAYAVAKVAGCPLLYKGDDFAMTDIRPAF